MPEFIAEAVAHPNPLFGNCFAIDVWLPDVEEKVWIVQGYISQDFQRSVISADLAERLHLQLNGEEANGNIVIQTTFYSDKVIHRSRPMPLTFRLAHPNAGDAYIHFGLRDLGAYLSVSQYDPVDDDDLPFVRLIPIEDPAVFCLKIPMR